MKIKIITQLNLGLVLSLAMIVTIAVSGWEMLEHYAEDAHIAYDSHFSGIIQLSQAESAFWRLRYGALHLISGEAVPQHEIIAEQVKWYTLIDDQLANYNAPEQHRTLEERQAIVEIQAQVQRTKWAHAKLVSLLQAGLHEDAKEWHAMTAQPYAMATMQAFWRLVALQQKIEQAAKLSSNTDLNFGRSLFIVTIASLLIMIGSGYWMGRRFMIPVKQLTQDARLAVQQALGEELKTSANGNEVDILVESFSMMTSKLVNRAENLDAARQALLIQGNLLEETVAARTVELRETIRTAEHQNHEITLRNEMGDVLQSCISVDEAVKTTTHYIQALFPGVAGALYFSGNSHITLELYSEWNCPPDRTFPSIFNFDECWGLRRAKPYLVSGNVGTIRCTHLPHYHSDDVSLCVPLAAQGEILGLLHFGFPGAVLAPNETPEQHFQVELASNVAAQIALAISNLRLRDALRQQSIRDALTGLHNRRFLEEALQRELARAIRAGQPLAVFMLDVDHFKQFNDQYGHEAGDMVLRELGRAMQGNCRKGDLACRFGGEEFTVILAETGMQQACEWGERLMHKVRTLEVKSGGTVLPHIAISMGLALFPEHADEMGTLLQAADLALYDAKHAGRDQMRVSGENV